MREEALLRTVRLSDWCGPIRVRLRTQAAGKHNEEEAVCSEVLPGVPTWSTADAFREARGLSGVTGNGGLRSVVGVHGCAHDALARQ